MTTPENGTTYEEWRKLPMYETMYVSCVPDANRYLNIMAERGYVVDHVAATPSTGLAGTLWIVMKKDSFSVYQQARERERKEQIGK